MSTNNITMRISNEPSLSFTTMVKLRPLLSKSTAYLKLLFSRWVKQYSTVETDDGEVLTAKQVKELQKRMAQLEEENQILKKAIAIFTPHSSND